MEMNNIHNSQIK